LHQNFKKDTINSQPKGKIMNKSELIDAIAAASELTKADAGKALDGFLDAVKTALSNGESVALVGFGTFSVKERAERKGRNPQSGEEITIPAAKIPAFKAGKTLKDAVQ
jgi:DNA-binding protein HU-beta